MQNFIFNTPTEMYFGKEQIKNLPTILNKYGKKVLMVYGGGSIKRNGIYDDAINLLKDLKLKKDLTILFISHDMNVIKYLADRVGIMYYGSLIEENYTSTIFKYPKEEYTKKLLNAVPMLKR